MSNCIILNYHSVIRSAGRNIHYDPVYSIQESLLESQFRAIKDSGIEVITLDQFPNLGNQNKKFLALTFDDGHISDYSVVFPLLKKFDLRASFFVTMKNVPEDSVRWHQYRQMINHGHYVGVHGLTHSYLTDLNFSQQFSEFYLSKKIIQEQLEIEDLYFSLPGGRYNNETLEISRQLGYKGLMTTHFGINSLDVKNYIWKRCTITSRYSNQQFRKLIECDPLFYVTETCKSKIKKGAQVILGSRLSDVINYSFIKW